MTNFFTPAAIEEAFDVTLPKRYRVFLEKKEYALHDGKLADLPTYSELLPVRFTGPELESFINEDWPEDDRDYGHPSATEVEFGGEAGWIPFATIGDEETQFLVLNVKEEECPIAMWEHENGEFEPVAASLDAFLAELEDNDEDDDDDDDDDDDEDEDEDEDEEME